MESDWQSAISILVATLGGAAIGMERQHSGHATGHMSRFGGLRTFTLLGMMAGAAGLLWLNGFGGMAVALVSGGVGLVLLSYWASLREDLDATTETAALVVLAAGFLSGQGAWRLSSGMVAVTTVLLAEKSRLHMLAEGVPGAGLRAGFRFGLMALVVLPLLPEGPFGPGIGVKPRELWMIVLLISGLSFVGYVARLVVGAKRGYVLTGLLGGLVSSTNVTLALSRLSRKMPGQAEALALGVLTACTVMYLRVAVVSSLLNPALGVKLVRYWLLPALTGAAVAWWGVRRHVSGSELEGEKAEANPLEVGAALQMAVLFQLVLYGISWMRDWFGQAGLMWSGAVLGLTDVDALTISMARSAGEEDHLRAAAMAVGVGCLTNSGFKLAVALVLGRGQFRKYAVGLFGLLAATAVAGLIWGWRG